MAAYMRKAGILPVCTNNEARAYFAGWLTWATPTPFYEHLSSGATRSLPPKKRRTHNNDPLQVLF